MVVVVVVVVMPVSVVVPATVVDVVSVFRQPAAKARIPARHATARVLRFPFLMIVSFLIRESPSQAGITVGGRGVPGPGCGGPACSPSRRGPSPSSPPTGAMAISASSASFDRACLRESLILPMGSTAMILTVTSSPSLTTSVVWRTRYGASSEMWTRPSWPGRISTKAPYGSTRRTLPV